MAKKDDKTYPAVKNLRTGRIQLLHEKNRQLVKRRDMRETLAVRDPETGAYVEVDDADTTTAIASSQNLERIGQQLLNLSAQRELLLTSALKLPGSEKYLQDLGVYQGDEDKQYIDPSSLKPNNAGLPTGDFTTAKVVAAEDVTEQLREEQEKAQKPVRRRTRKSTEQQDELKF